MSDKRAVALVVLIMLAVGAWGTYYFRATYSHAKRLRVVEPGKLYRSGQLTADGFREAIQKYGIRTIVNVQEDVPDPLLVMSLTDRRTMKESDLCQQLGVRYVWLAPDLLPPDQVDKARPLIIDQFVELMDRKDIYPVLLHCKAGLHRTGLLSAVYRVEYQGCSHLSAHRELRAHGFGDWASTRANPYVDQYLLRYKPRAEREGVTAQRPE